jgi:hypothetical protein
VILSELIYLTALCYKYPAKTNGYGDELRELESLKKRTRQFLRIHYSLSDSKIDDFLEMLKKSSEKDFYSYMLDTLDTGKHSLIGNDLRFVKTALESVISFDDRIADFDAIEASKKHCLKILLELARLFNFRISQRVERELTQRIKDGIEAYKERKKRKA